MLAWRWKLKIHASRTLEGKKEEKENEDIQAEQGKGKKAIANISSQVLTGVI